MYNLSNASGDMSRQAATFSSEARASTGIGMGIVAAFRGRSWSGKPSSVIGSSSPDFFIRFPLCAGRRTGGDDARPCIAVSIHHEEQSLREGIANDEVALFFAGRGVAGLIVWVKEGLGGLFEGDAVLEDVAAGLFFIPCNCSGTRRGMRIPR